MSSFMGREVIDDLAIVCPRLLEEVTVPAAWTFISECGPWDLCWPCRECDDIHAEPLTLEIFDALQVMGYDLIPELVVR